MAKVTGPLHSLSASGTLGKALVFFNWKGISVVREWLIPKNLKSEDQGAIRVILGGLGRAASPVVNGSQYHIDAKTLVVGGTTWISQFVKYIMATYMHSGTTFDAEYDIWNACANQALWQTEARALALSKFHLTYADLAGEFQHGLQLYELAQYAFNQHALNPLIFTNAIYETPLCDWDQAAFDAFVIEIQTVV